MTIAIIWIEYLWIKSLERMFDDWNVIVCNQFLEKIILFFFFHFFVQTNESEINAWTILWRKMNRITLNIHQKYIWNTNIRPHNSFIFDFKHCALFNIISKLNGIIIEMSKDRQSSNLLSINIFSFEMSIQLISKLRNIELLHVLPSVNDRCRRYCFWVIYVASWHCIYADILWHFSNICTY